MFLFLTPRCFSISCQSNGSSELDLGVEQCTEYLHCTEYTLQNTTINRSDFIPSLSVISLVETLPPDLSFLLRVSDGRWPHHVGCVKISLSRIDCGRITYKPLKLPGRDQLLVLRTETRDYHIFHTCLRVSYCISDCPR